MKSAFIDPSCSQAPQLVAGLPRRERLIRTLLAQGYSIASEKTETSEIWKECELPTPKGPLHLCEKSQRDIEAVLMESLKKPVDGVIAKYLNRRISLSITRRLMNTDIRPNTVSLFNILIGILSGILASRGTWAWMFAAACLLQIQSLMDGVDGELARLKFQTSKLGQWLDTASDDLAELSFLTGLTIAMTSSFYHRIGIAAIASFLIGKFLMYRTLVIVYRSGDLLSFEWSIDEKPGFLKTLKSLFKHDFLCLLYLVLILLHLPWLALMIMSGGYIVFLIGVLSQGRKK